MYSMFDLFFDTPSYRPIYVISESEMRELQREQNLKELDEIITFGFVYLLILDINLVFNK